VSGARDIDTAWAVYCHNGGMPLTTTPFDRATFKAGWAAAIAAEREECAKVALVDRGPHGEPPAEWHDEVARVGAVATVRVAIKMTREEIAAAIRARGEAKGGAE
jgi:hypothetical protein